MSPPGAFGIHRDNQPADDSVAPALQAAKEKLQRSQLEVSGQHSRCGQVVDTNGAALDRTNSSMLSRRGRSPKSLSRKAFSRVSLGPFCNSYLDQSI